MSPANPDELRAAAFAWLAEQERRTGPLFTRDQLAGAVIAGEPMGLIDRNRGIRNPRQLNATLSVLTSDDGPYEDNYLDDDSGFLRYAFRAGRTDRGDNAKLVRAHELGVPIIYFIRVRPNVYAALHPVYVARVEASAVLLDASGSAGAVDELGTITIPQRRYAASVTRRRLHQVMFRGRVMAAYDRRCTVCRLREPTLLEAGHITGDADGGSPAVTNGLSLCSIHHRAFDGNLLGIDADARVHIAPRLLADSDGPMLRHGLQEMHGASLALPSRRAEHPDRDALSQRFRAFLDVV